MSLLIRIVELIGIILVIRAFLRLMLPGQTKKPAPRQHPGKPERFNGRECDISDGDYEDVR